jgi:hypothetical protein
MVELCWWSGRVGHALDLFGCVVLVAVVVVVEIFRCMLPTSFHFVTVVENDLTFMLLE